MDQPAYLASVNMLLFVAGFVHAMLIFRKSAAGASRPLPGDIGDESIGAAIHAKQTIGAFKGYRAQPMRAEACRGGGQAARAPTQYPLRRR